MNKLKLTFAASLLIVGIAHADPACNGFHVTIKNNLTEDLSVSRVKLDGAKIDPGVLKKIDSKKEQIFTVNESQATGLMSGELAFQTVSIPSKKVKLKFTLENKGPICNYVDAPQDSVFSIEKTRVPGTGVDYTISAK